MRNLITAIVLLFFSSVLAQNKFEKINNAACICNKVRQFDNRFDWSERPGYTMIVFTKDSVLFSHSRGMINVEDKTPIDINTPFYSASITKSFTAAAILQLTEKSKLDIDDQLQIYLKNLPQYTHDITIKNLLNHSSGLPEYTAIENWEIKIRTNEDVLNLIRSQDTLQFYPGSDFSYSNTGYVLLAEIIEKVTGVTYEDYITNHFLKPLNMTNSFFANKEANYSMRAIGYEIQEDGNIALNDTEGYRVNGSTGLYCSASDLMKWLRAFDDNVVLSETSKNAMVTYPMANGKQGYYNMGWFNETLGKHANDLTGFQQNGLVGVSAGFRSYLIKSKNHDFNYIILSNYGKLPFEIIGKDLISCYFKRAK